MLKRNIIKLSVIFRKYIVTVLILAFSINNSIAQVDYGVKAGLNMSTYHYGYTSTDPDYRLGLNAGVFVQLPIKGNVRLHTEAIVSVKGHKVEGPFYKGQFNLLYINVPILLGIKAGQFLFLAGPELGYLAAQDYTNGLQFAENHRGFDLGLDAGVLYNFSPRLGTELRYNHGVFKAYRGVTTNGNGVMTGYENRGGNRCFHLNFYYKIK